MKKRFLLPGILAGLLAAGCGNGEEETIVETPQMNMDEHMAADDGGEFEVPIEDRIGHIHGMGYIEAEEGIYFASHHGLRIYRDGEWLQTAEHHNDYMGFNTVDRGFYTSGHPGMDSDLPNPIGIHRSMDGGRTLEHLGFKGETDFHVMAVGYRSHDIFLLNPDVNSEMEPGFYRSSDEGTSWEPVEPQGLDGQLMALAMHPDDSQWVAASTTVGIFLSEDGGENFTQLTAEGESGTAVYFTETDLYFGSYGSSPALTRYTLEMQEQEALPLPKMTGDAVAYIAQNPNNEDELAISSFEINAFLSEDGGQNWKMILDSGEPK